MRTNTQAKQQSNAPTFVLVGVIGIVVAVIAIASYLTNGSL